MRSLTSEDLFDAMLYIECYPDEVLVKALGVVKKNFIHEGGKFEICKRLQKVNNCTGLIENDFGLTHPLYLKQCSKLGEEHDIHVHFQKSSGNTVIIINNTLEEWIIKKGIASHIDSETFGLSNDPKQLHKEINSKLTNFGKFVDKLLEEKCPALLYLQKLVRKQ